MACKATPNAAPSKAEAPASSIGGLQPEVGGSGNFKLIATSKEDEDAFDYTKFRSGHKSGVLGSIANLVKGALGAGVLSGHVAYMKSGYISGIAIHFFFGSYMTFCLYMLSKNAQVLMRRTRVPSMTYSDIGEASAACHPNPKVKKFSLPFRYFIDVIICIDLFGSCATYQLIIAKTIKQLVENTQRVEVQGLPGYPNLRVYIAAMIIPIILICFITELKWLAPFSLLANAFIAVAIGVTIYYGTQNNPTFSNMVGYTELFNQLEGIGISVFSMSCVGVVIPIENAMKNPKKFSFVLLTGMSIIIFCVFVISLFGYAGYLDKCETPVTINFPLTTLPIILKGFIAGMLYVTHALNFWVPFNICFYYIKKRYPPESVYRWELFYRACFVLLISLIAIVFPSIAALMGFLGTFCLSNMAFIWPNIINILNCGLRPGFGKFKWRLLLSFILIVIGVFICVCGTMVNSIQLAKASS